jgi:hypothetical protein
MAPQVLVIGFKDLARPSFVDRLKRDLKVRHMLCSSHL